MRANADWAIKRARLLLPLVNFVDVDDLLVRVRDVVEAVVAATLWGDGLWASELGDAIISFVVVLVVVLEGVELLDALELPVEDGVEEVSDNDDGDVVHVVPVDGEHWREGEEDDAEGGPAQEDDVGDEADLAEPEGPVGDVAPLLQQTYHGDDVGEQEEGDTARDEGVERRRRGEVEQADDGDPGAGHEVCVEGHTDAGVDLGPQVGPWETLVSGEGPAESGLPRVAGDDTAEGGEEDEAAEEDGTALVAERLVVDIEDGGAGG